MTPKLPEPTETDIPEDAAFLPINCVYQNRAMRNYPTLVLVDKVLVPELEQFNWRTDAGAKAEIGHVYRRISDSGLRNDLGKLRYVREGLAARITGAFQSGERVLYRNGDRLDCRRKNLMTQSEAKAYGMSDWNVAVPAGHTFHLWPATMVAAMQRSERIKELAARFPLGRKARLSSDQILSYLTDILEIPAFQRRSWVWHAGNLTEICGQKISQYSARDILRGDQQRQPGFDYEKLRPLLPDRLRLRRDIISRQGR